MQMEGFESFIYFKKCI